MKFRIVAVVVSLVVASLACMRQIPQPAPTLVVASPSTAATIGAGMIVAEPSRTPTPAPDPKYTVVASKLYVRDNALDVVSHLDYGDVVSCHLLPSGWCLIYRDQMVWSGCLDPNSMQLECKAR